MSSNPTRQSPRCEGVLRLAALPVTFGPEDPLEALARELRQGAGAEMRAEADLDEQETEKGRQRRRTMADEARRAMARADTVSVTVGGRTLSGHVDAVGSDYLVLVTATTAADIRLDRVVLRVRPQPRGGQDGRPGSATFKARLAEYEHTGEPVTLIIGPDETEGIVTLVAVDHLRVTTPDAEELVVPLDAVTAVLRPLPAT